MVHHRNPVGTDEEFGAREWAIDDEVTHLREWGSQRLHPLPSFDEEITIGAAESCELRLSDPTRRISRRHARLYRQHAGWAIRDLGSRNGTRVDGARRNMFLLAPGVEVGIGRITLIAESRGLISLRGFLTRLLGWSTDRLTAVDRALRGLRMAATRRRALVVCGEGDLVPIAQSLHRRTLGDGRPFVVWDPRRPSAAASVRAAESYPEARTAMDAAAGGTICVRGRRFPHNFYEVALALREPASRSQLVVCTPEVSDARVLLADPVIIPPLSHRRAEIEWIIDEYAADAIANLAAEETGFTDGDRAWVIEHSSATLPDIEKATRRLVAVRQAGTIAQAAVRLGMSHVALAQWLERRRLP